MAGVRGEVVGAQAGQSPDQVELAEPGPFGAVHPGAGAGERGPGDAQGGVVQGSQGPVVAAVERGGDVEDERERGGTEEQAAR